MCGRFVASSSADDIAAHFDAVLTAESPRPEPRFNVAPSTEVLVVGERLDTDTGELVRAVRGHRWGLVPHWAKDPRIGNKMINARAETLATKSSFKRPLAKKRCIVPADGFYEWRRLADGSKQPVFISATDGVPLAFAGLWETWHDAEDNVLRSVTIITTSANDTLAPVHDRMPVILPPAAWPTWLSPQNTDIDAVTPLLVPAPDDAVRWWDVTSDVGNVRNDRPDLVTPLPSEP